MNTKENVVEVQEEMDQVMEQNPGMRIEKDKIINARFVGTAAAVLGGLYVCGVTGVTSGKLLGTVAGAAASYYVSEKMEELSGDDEIFGIALSASTGSLLGMLAAGAGGCLDGKKSNDDKPLSELSW